MGGGLRVGTVESVRHENDPETAKAKKKRFPPCKMGASRGGRWCAEKCGLDTPMEEIAPASARKKRRTKWRGKENSGTHRSRDTDDGLLPNLHHLLRRREEHTLAASVHRIATKIVNPSRAGVTVPPFFQFRGKTPGFFGLGPWWNSFESV